MVTREAGEEGKKEDKGVWLARVPKLIECLWSIPSGIAHQHDRIRGEAGLGGRCVFSLGHVKFEMFIGKAR